ncbi:hypothetical protein [Litorimonas sp. WD9-15]|uniref:hypothetical protein n=1 Tax=Litorimonas sp. WD9-15 TaxID=3418716 RepID=UPI003CFCD053
MSAMTAMPGPDEDAQAVLVRQALELICEDALFRDTTRMKRFLRFVVEETLEGRGDRLKGYTIGVEVFDRPDDFDPQADTIVRVQAGQLRRRLDLYYAEHAKDSQVRILIPKGRYSPIFEMRQNIPDDATLEAGDVAKAVTDIKTDPRPSIAVLSLDDLTPNEGEGAYFTDGLTAEIVNALVQFRSMRIVTMTASVATHLKERSVREVAEESGAEFVLSGNVRRDGDVFRVMVQLIRADTNEHLMSRVFDREYSPGSLFNLQEDIASYTAAAVAAPFGAVNRYNRRRLIRQDASIQAYECVLRFYDIQLRPTRNKANELLKTVEAATSENPGFSSGWAIQSLMHAFLVSQCFPVADPVKHLKEADRCGRLAIELDNQNALGYFALYQTYYHRGEFENANRMIRRAMALNPNNYSILAYHAVCLALRGYNKEALTMQAAALRLIGRAPPWFYVPQMIVDYREGQYDAVAAWLGRDPLNLPAAFQAFGLSALVYLDRIDEAKVLIAKLDEEFPGFLIETGRSACQWHLASDLTEKLKRSVEIAGLDMRDIASSI